MKRKYKMPIRGKVLAKEPLTGENGDPICVIPFGDLPDLPTYFDKASQQQVKESFGYTCLDYNIDEGWCEVELTASEEFHNWLAGILPQLRDIQKEKGWKLDKSKMIEKLEKK
ncbi:unnamed protein product [marine sediment metagenome]|uniref:Uncharacterized protein n=1 Tax=marine sediment metagenome TaxID=412755 RepID=X1MN02_9ZZZZ